MIPCSYWASTCLAALPSCRTSYMISVRQTRDLSVVSLFPHPASFRFHLTVDTLAFDYILPTTGRIQDFHLLETCAARRTRKKDIAAKLCPFQGIFNIFLLIHDIRIATLLIETFAMLSCYGSMSASPKYSAHFSVRSSMIACPPAER